MLAGDRGPSALAEAHDDNDGEFETRLNALVAENVPEGEGVQRTAIRHRLSRRLLDDPVVYLTELDEAEREYFNSQRGAMCRRLAAATGLTAEHRGEGSALVDEAGELTDTPLPQQGTDAHATLLLAEFLADRMRAGDDSPVPDAEITAFMRDAAREHRKYWRKTAQDAGAERELANAALHRLEALRLISRQGDTVHPLPAVCRFRLGESKVRQQDLF